MVLMAASNFAARAFEDLNRTLQDQWEQDDELDWQPGEHASVKDVLRFSCRNMKSPKSTQRSRSILKALILGIVLNVVSPGLEDYVLQVFPARGGDLEAPSRVLRNSGSRRQIGAVDPGRKFHFRNELRTMFMMFFI